MSKIQIPAEYKAFEDKFSALAYGQDDSKVFDDMLTFIIDLFSFDNPWKPHGRYKDLEIRKRFFELFYKCLFRATVGCKTQNREFISCNSWIVFFSVITNASYKPAYFVLQFHRLS